MIVVNGAFMVSRIGDHVDPMGLGYSSAQVNRVDGTLEEYWCRKDDKGRVWSPQVGDVLLLAAGGSYSLTVEAVWPCVGGGQSAVCRGTYGGSWGAFCASTGVYDVTYHPTPEALVYSSACDHPVEWYEFAKARALVAALREYRGNTPEDRDALATETGLLLRGLLSGEDAAGVIDGYLAHRLVGTGAYIPKKWTTQPVARLTNGGVVTLSHPTWWAEDEEANNLLRKAEEGEECPPAVATYVATSERGDEIALALHFLQDYRGPYFNKALAAFHEGGLRGMIEYLTAQEGLEVPPVEGENINEALNRAGVAYVTLPDCEGWLETTDGSPIAVGEGTFRVLSSKVSEEQQ